MFSPQKLKEEKQIKFNVEEMKQKQQQKSIKFFKLVKKINKGKRWFLEKLVKLMTSLARLFDKKIRNHEFPIVDLAQCNFCK